MSGRRSRVARKAARVEQTQLDRDFNAGIGALRKDRDELLRKANAAYEKGLAKLREQRVEARVEADRAYDNGRTELLRALTVSEEKAA